jgi:hypothetical protein
MLNLYDKLRDAPFLRERSLDVELFADGIPAKQPALL